MTQSLRWAEFPEWNPEAQRWVAEGNIALTPYIMARSRCGESRYLHARDVDTFRAACELLGGTVTDFPRRHGINLDGEFLLRAIVRCRVRERDTALERLTRNPVGVEPWTSRCPECGLPFDNVAEHVNGPLVFRTLAACARGHRWAV